MSERCLGCGRKDGSHDEECYVWLRDQIAALTAERDALVKELEFEKEHSDRQVECKDRHLERADRAEAECVRLRSYIQGAMPFLEEAWAACFDGKKEKLLSCEERGMGMLLGQFREIAKGERVLPPDCVTSKEAHEIANNATAWAHKLLGNPNELREEIRDYIGLGQTCAHGIVKAHGEIVRLRGELQEANRRLRELS